MAQVEPEDIQKSLEDVRCVGLVKASQADEIERDIEELERQLKEQQEQER